MRSPIANDPANGEHLPALYFNIKHDPDSILSKLTFRLQSNTNFSEQNVHRAISVGAKARG
jgi:hypothetical protein